MPSSTSSRWRPADFSEYAHFKAVANTSRDAAFESAIAAHNAVDGVNGDTEMLDTVEGEAGEETPVAANIAEFWKAVERDAEFLEADARRSGVPGKLVASLSESALWPNGMPVWAGRRWADLKDELPDNEGWNVWVDWYEGRLAGRRADEATEFDRVTIPKEEWERGPSPANAKIQGMTSTQAKPTTVGTARGLRGRKNMRRYYSPDDPNTYITPSRFRRLGKKNQIADMVHWFHGMFEDPANETPYESREGGYQYIWGGPYEAGEELGGEFGDIVSDGVIEAAVSEVESDGIFDWAPTSSNPHHRASLDDEVANVYEPPPPIPDDIRERLASGVALQFGDPVEAKSRSALRDEISRLRESMEQDASIHGGIGHNRPPDSLSLSVELTVEVTQAIEEIDDETAKSSPNVDAVVESTGRLEKVLAWIGRKLDKSVDGFMKTLGALGAGAGAADLAGVAVWENIAKVFRAALEWLDAITLPF